MLIYSYRRQFFLRGMRGSVTHVLDIIEGLVRNQKEIDFIGGNNLKKILKKYLQSQLISKFEIFKK